MLRGLNPLLTPDLLHALASMGATVIAVARDARRGQAVVDEIRRETGNEEVHLRVCDVSSQTDVRRFAAGYREEYDRLHLLDGEDVVESWAVDLRGW